MLKKLVCILFNRHKPLLLNALDKNPLMTISDCEQINGISYRRQSLLEVHMCQNCNLVYWKPSE